MALADNILSPTRRAYHRASVALIPLIPRSVSDSQGTNYAITDINYQESFDQPCPLCTLSTAPAVGWAKQGYPVEVNLGYDGLNRRVFTGTVQPRGRPGVGRGQLDCAGQLWKLQRAKFTTERDVGGLTVAQGISAIFDAVGITDYDVSAVPAYTLAAAATIPAGTGFSQLDQLMMVDGLRVRETGAGQVIVARYEGTPSASAFRKYSTDGENIKILDGGVTENPGWYLTEVTVLGARLADGSDVGATVTLSDTSLAQPPLPSGQQIPDTFSIPLIWTSAKALEAAQRIAAEHGRIPQTFRMTIPLDPQLEIGMTLGISAPEWDVTGNWLIWGIQHSAASETTVCSLVGGPQFGGTINVNPVASFTFKAENQPLGAQRYTFVTLDASGSYQPDNLSEVLTYDWAGDQDAADSPAIDSQTAAKFTVQLDPTAMSGDVLTVTLIVTNAAGLTRTVIKEINITPEATDAIVVGIAAALKTRFGFSGDGGETWNFQTGTDITSCAAALDNEHAQYAVYGRDNGQIYRTTDGCATAPTSVRGSTAIAIVDIKWDWRDPAKVWALDAQCNLLLSLDYGATFVTIVAWRTSMSLATIIGKRLLLRDDGYVWVFGGTGVTSNGRPFIGRFKSGEAPFGFASVFGGNLSTDLGAGTTTLAVADAVYQASGGLLIVLENYTAYNGAVFPAYWCPDPMAPTGWKRIGNAEGLDSGVTTAGRVALPANAGPGYFHMMFNDRDAWHINTTSGTPVATVTADFLDVGFTPNEGLWLADEQEGLPSAECHIIAVQDAAGNGAIIKSFDDMVTQADILPGMTAWPVVGAMGKDVAIGPAGQLATAAKIIIAVDLVSPDDVAIAWREGQGNFTAKIFATMDGKDLHKIRPISADVWFTIWDSVNGISAPVATRTKDGGATWDDPYAVPAANRLWQDIQRAADGRLWSFVLDSGDFNHQEIWYNDDPEGDGAWTESKDITATDGSNRPRHVLPHPTNANRIAVIGGTTKKFVVWITLNRGTTWTENLSTDLRNGEWGHHMAAMMLASNRIVACGYADGTNKATIWTSDDNGAAWTARKTFDDILSGSTDNIWGPVGDSLGNRLFVMVVDKAVSPYDIQIWESNDQGTTWTQLVSAALGNKPPQPATTDEYKGGMSYDPTEGALYLFGAGEDNLDNIAQVVKTVGLGWQDVSDNLIAALTGHTKYKLTETFQTYSIAVIPS